MILYIWQDNCRIVLTTCGADRFLIYGWKGYSMGEPCTPCVLPILLLLLICLSNQITKWKRQNKIREQIGAGKYALKDSFSSCAVYISPWINILVELKEPQQVCSSLVIPLLSLVFVAVTKIFNNWYWGYMQNLPRQNFGKYVLRLRWHLLVSLLVAWFDISCCLLSWASCSWGRYRLLLCLNFSWILVMFVTLVLFYRRETNLL